MILAAVTFDNIFSGLIGAFLGIASAWAVAWWQSREKAKSHLRSLLLSLGHDLYHSADTFELLKAAYLPVLTATHEYRGKIFLPRKREQLSAACNQLLGHNPASKSRHCFCPPKQEEALRATEAFLKFLGEDELNQYEQK